MTNTLKRLTGSGGTAPVLDGTVRGTITAALLALLQFVNNKSAWLTDDDVALLMPVVMLVSFVIWGLWDRYIASRL